MTDTLRRLVAWLHSERFPTWCIPEDTVRELSEALGPGWEVRVVRESTSASGDGSREAPAAVLEAVHDAEIYFGWGITPDVFAAGATLRWVHSAAAGARASLFPAMRESHVMFTNSAGIYAEPLAEWAIAAMLFFARGFDLAVSAKSRRLWPYDEMAAHGHPLRELTGATVAVIGYGGIGRAIGRRASALGMRVRGLRSRSGSEMDSTAEIAGPDALPEVLGAADYVVLCVPETSDTQGLIGPVELSRMRSDAVLINLSRGGILDEGALAEFLRGGRIRGAALDVFREEPLPDHSPLWDLDNVLITPHAGSISPRFWERETDLMVRNIGHYLCGSGLENLVDKQRGY